MSIPMISPVTMETINGLNPDAGLMLHDVEISSATDAESLVKIITNEESQKKWLGATKGGVNVQENREYWSPEFDGKRMPYKGEKRFSTANPKMTGSLVVFTPENVKFISGAADIDSSGGSKIKVQPRASINDGDYFAKILYITNNGPDGLYVVEMDNCLCTTGMNSQTADKNIATLPFEFSAHSDSVVFKDELPVRYWFYRASGAAAAAASEEPSQEQEE